MARRRRRSSDWQKLHPKLRMVANGSTRVNVFRAEHAAAVLVPPPLAVGAPPARGDDAIPRRAPRVRPAPKRLREIADAYVSCFLQFVPEAGDLTADVPREIGAVTAAKSDLATAVLPLERVLALRDSDLLAAIELGQPLQAPDPLISPRRVRAPSVDVRRFGDPRRHRFGEDVLIGLIDVGGFDFAHPDFLADGKTRFVAIWDQGGTTRPTPAANGRIAFNYGSELLGEQLNLAIRKAPRERLPPQLLEPQSQMSSSSHGTHVASIAAGSRGVCRRAKIAAVLIAIPEDDVKRRGSFYDSTRLAHAVDYLLAVAEDEGLPISINISLGTNGHAHDDSSPIARWIDASLTRRGRCVCVAAGNAGQEMPESPEDTGYVFGRVHSSGTIPARELTAEVEWNVAGNGIADLSENELEVWYSPADRFSAQVKPPGGTWTDAVQPGEFIENRQLPDGSMLSVYNELYHPANGANLIAIYLSPYLEEPQVGVPAGQWLVRLIGEEIRDGRYDCWIERDDPRRVGRLGGRESWWFPSYFSERSFVDRSTISTLACGPRVVAVANLDGPRRTINKTSSQGPTRDGREKPDVAAPGTDIVAAKGFAGDDHWASMTGTSMASPYVAGVAGLMLGVNPKLTAAQIGGILRRTAQPLAGSDFRWRDDAGVGEIDPRRCLDEAAAMDINRDIT
jgi:subtilisin family serine protease